MIWLDEIIGENLWLLRADQVTKTRKVFVDPSKITYCGEMTAMAVDDLPEVLCSIVSFDNKQTLLVRQSVESVESRIRTFRAKRGP